MQIFALKVTQYNKRTHSQSGVPISHIMRTLEQIAHEQEGLRQSIQKLKSKILDLAIHGKLVPQDPNDEPAIELLKRINPNFIPCDTSHYENLPSGWTRVYYIMPYSVNCGSNFARSARCNCFKSLN